MDFSISEKVGFILLKKKKFTEIQCKDFKTKGKKKLKYKESKEDLGSSLVLNSISLRLKLLPNSQIEDAYLFYEGFI